MDYAPPDDAQDDNQAGGRYVSGDRHSWSGPRTVVVPRCLGDGFGFTLRHLVIHPPDGTTSSTYIDDEDLYTDEYDQDESVQHSQASSLDSMDTIFVKHVRVGGPADIAGLEIGDRILSVNGESVTGNSYSQVISLIQSSDATLKLLVVPRHEDILQMAYQRSVYETSQESHRCSSGDYTSSPVYSQQGSYIRYTRSGSMPSSAASSEVVHSRVGTHDRYETGSVSSRHSSGSDLSSRLRYPTVDHRVCQEDRENHNITDIPSGTVGRYSTAATRQSRGDAGQDILPMREPLRDYSTNYKLDEQNIDVSVKQGLNSTIGSGSSSRVREDGPSLEKSTSRSPYALYYPPPSLIKKESSSDMDRGIASSSHVHIGSSVKPTPYSGPAPWNRHSRNVSDIVGYSSSRPYAYSSSHSNSSQDTNPSYSQDNVWTMTKGHGKDSAAIRHPVKVEHQIGISGLFPRSQTISGLTHQSSNNNNVSDWRPARPAVSVGSLPYEGQTRSTIEVEPHPDKRNSGRFYGGVSTRSLLNRQLETDNTEPGSHTSQRYTPVLSPRSVLLNSNSNPCSPTRQPSLGGKGREELPSEQLSPARTLVVRISERGGKQQGDSPIVHTVTDQPHLMRSNQFSVATSNAYPAGTAFAVTRTQDGVKIDAYSNQKASPASITERKKRFEAGKENVSGGSHDISDMGKRYKTELRKLQSLGKLESVSKNMAHFESFSDSHESSPSSGTDERQSDANDNDSSKIFHITSQQILGQSVPLQSDNTLNMNRTKLQNRRVETQHSDMREQRQDLALVMPASVQERRLNEASQISALQSQSHAHPVETYAIQPAVKVRRIGAERYEYPESTISQRNDTETPKIPTTVPVRVIVPPSASNFSAPVSKFEQDGQPISHSTTSSQPQQYYPQYPPPNSTTSSTSQLSLYSSAPVHPSRHRNRDVMVFTPDSKPLTGSPYIHYMSTTPPDILDGAVTSRLIQPPDRKVTYATPVATPLGKFMSSHEAEKQKLSASEVVTVTTSSMTVTTVMATMATAATTILTAVSGTLGSSGSMPLPPPYTVSYSMAPASTMAPMYSADGIPVVMMRRRPPEECVFVADDDSLKLSRRTSYLMATSKDRTNLNLPVNQTAAAAAAASSVQSSEQQQLSISPKGVAGKKWKPMFGDKRISEQPEMPGDSDFSSSPMMEVVKQGWLYCKTSMLDGKRCSDRSWKLVWAVLRGHALYLSKEKRDSLGSFTLEEQPISIKSSVVDIANHYTKRKHVFGLQTYNGSEYLFQADGPEVMTAWIEAIQTHNDPDGDDQGVLVSDLIVRRSAQQQSQEPHTPPPQTVQQQTGTTTGLQVKTSPVAMHKSLKKSAAMTLKSKIPYSPSLRRKHKGDKDEFGKPKDLKEQKTWKDKLGKSLRRFGSGTSSATTPGGTAIADDELPTATFGVPLYLCMPSPCSDYVPLIIEICTRLVEVRGLEVVGIYRVPGNTAAVTLMQEEINRGVEHINSDNDRWFDVNVIGSLLKAFIRKLPDPIITDELYESFIRANRVENPIRRMLSLKRLLHELPEHNFETFHHLARHLQLVASYSNMNKMDARNLAIVFGPTLIRRKEGDMATMVADMSDQCRIIESLIHHNEWFFGSWDMDSHVPIANDEGEATPLTRLVRDDDDERDRDVDPKEIVTSIIQAASRKMQGKMTQDDIAISATDFQMRERNIDLEISRRKAKSHEFLSQDVIVKTVQMTSMSKSYDARDSTGQVTPPPPPLPPRISSVPAKSTSMHSVPVDDVDDWVFVRSHSESVPAHIGHDPASQGFVRRMSDDSLADKNDELEISHGSIGAGYSLSRDTVDRLKVDRLKRIELEARGLREREEQRQRDCEKHRIEQHRIEQELQRTKRELELEDGHSLDDLIRQTEFTQQISDFSQQLSEAGSKKNVSRSLMTSTGNIQGLVSGLGVLPTVTVTGRTVGIAGKVYSSTASSGTAADKQSESAIGEKYRYFVSIGNSRISRDKDHSKDDPVHKISAEYLESMGKRVGSLETIVDSNGKVTTPHKKSIRHPGARSRHDKGKPSEHSNNRSDHLGMGSRASLTRSNSGRRGSLDSLRDFYDKPDNRLSWVSTDSEDGSDLLADLTTTFDRKLQILLNPKFRLDGNLRRQNSNKADESDNVSTASDAKDTKELKTEPPPKAVTATTVFQKPFEPIFQKPTGQESSRTGGPFERLFRDPSLHRTYKPEPIIGIASRFERGIAVPSTHVHTGTALLQNIQHVTQTAGQNSYNTLTDGTTDISSSSSSTAVTAPQSRNKNVSHNYSSNACSNTSNITASNNTANASNADYKPSTTTSHPNVDLKFVYSLPSVVQRCLEEEYDPVPYRDFGNVHTTTCNSVVQEIPRDSMSPSVSTSDRHAENHERNRDSLTKKQEFSMKHDEKLSSITDKKQKSDSYSPTDSRVTQKQHEISAQRRKRSERENRRHTVGGIDDAEHFKALIALSKTQAKTDSATRLSAWDQLQAQGVKGSLLSWLQNERLRSSTSNLTSRSSSIRNLSSSCGNLAES